MPGHFPPASWWEQGQGATSGVLQGTKLLQWPFHCMHSTGTTSAASGVRAAFGVGIVPELQL